MNRDMIVQLILVSALMAILFMVQNKPFPPGSDVYIGLVVGSICTLLKQSPGRLNDQRKDDIKKDEVES